MEHKDVSQKAKELGSPERRARDELASKNEKLEDEPGTAKEVLRGLRELCADTRRVGARSKVRRKEKAVVVTGDAQNRISVQR